MAYKPPRGLGKGLGALLGDDLEIDSLRKPVGYINKDFRHQSFYLAADFLQRLYPVMQIKNLTAPLYFPSDCLGYTFIGKLVYNSLYGLTVLWRCC